MLKHKKIRKRIPALLICILYTMTVLLSMTGCGTKKTGSGGTASEAVSYTHLDVYKRQIYARQAEPFSVAAAGEKGSDPSGTSQ